MRKASTTKSKRNFVWRLALTSFITCSAAYGQSFPVTPGSARGSAVNVISEPSSSSGTFYLNAKAGHSYCCEIALHPSQTIAEHAYFLDVFDPAGAMIFARSRGDAEPVISVFDEHPASLKTRRCFTPTADGYHSLPAQLGISGNGNTGLFNVECDETTLYGGFNTSVTDFNFLELTNTLTGHAVINAVTVEITVTNAITKQAIINKQSMQIAPGDRADIDLHTPAGHSVFGTVVVSHDGPPGSLKGVVSQYVITSTNPLAFVPVAREVLTTR